MNACVLVAAPPSANRALVAALTPAFEVMSCTHHERAEWLAALGSFQAIVVAADFAPALVHAPDDAPILRVDPSIAPLQLLGDVQAALLRRRQDDLGRAAELVGLATLPYDEYIELVRFRATRQYLLGLMRLYHGSVTEASHSAGIVRESLHRLLRRHSVDAEDFRGATGHQ